MPGIVVAAHADARLAEALVRRAAEPLLRRPWESLALEVARDRRAALGFAGERGGAAADPATGRIAAFDGELFGPVRTGAAAASELLELYGRAGTALEPPDGCFSAAIWDPDTGALVLVVDRQASRPLYVWERPGGGVVVAGELKALPAAGLEPELDLQGVAEMLAYRHLLGTRTLFAGVRLLPGGTTLVVGPEGIVDERRRWRFTLRPEPHGDDRELAEEFGRLLVRALDARLDGTEAVTLSGGLDTRCLAAALGARGIARPAVTWAWPGSSDRRPAAAVAAAAGLEHRVLELPRGFADVRASRCIWLAEWRRNAFWSQELSFAPLRHDGLGALLLAAHGDLSVRMKRAPEAAPGDAAYADAVHAARAALVSDSSLEQLFEPAFADELRGRARSALARVLDEEEGDRHALLAELRYRNVSSKALFDDHLAPRDVLSDHDLVDFCARLPYRLRFHGEIERAFVRTSPTLARIPDPENGIPPSLTGTAERLSRRAAAARRALRRRARPLGHRTRRRHAHWHHALGLPRQDPGVLGILLEERTLDRGQLRAEPVGRLVAETLRGSARYVAPLVALVGFELFQRQLVDGDGEPGEPGA